MLQTAIELLVSCFVTAEFFNVRMLIQPQSKSHFMCFNCHSFRKTNKCSTQLWMISTSHTHHKCGATFFFPFLLLEQPWSWGTVLNITTLGFPPLLSFLLLHGGKNAQYILSYCISALRIAGECDSTVFPAITNLQYKWHRNPLPTVLLLLAKLQSPGFWCYWKKRCHLLSWIPSHQCPQCSSCHWGTSYIPHILLPIESKFYIVEQT